MGINKEQYGLLTDAEVQVAERRVDGGMSVDEAVASVKAERVGPAAINDETPAANVPGGHIAPPSVNGPEAHLEQLYRQRDQLNAEIATVEQDVQIRRTAYGAGVIDTTTPVDDTTTPAEPTAELTVDSSDEEISDANADDVVAFVAANPDQVDRVRTLEQAREKPRKTVLAAVGAGD